VINRRDSDFSLMPAIYELNGTEYVVFCAVAMSSSHTHAYSFTNAAGRNPAGRSPCPRRLHRLRSSGTGAEITRRLDLRGPRAPDGRDIWRLDSLNLGSNRPLTIAFDKPVQAFGFNTDGLLGGTSQMIQIGATGFAVPDVDEIATVALNLWAEERGYTRWAANR
jgi:hypothetical protein